VLRVARITALQKTHPAIIRTSGLDFLLKG